MESTAYREGRSELKPFGPGSLLWEGLGDVRLMLVLGGALIMQVMHPQIGAAVGQQSVYRTDPWGRLTRSLASLQTWVYGGAEAIEEGRRLREMHKTITGVDHRGRKYHALSAEPYAWVHLTAFERSVTMAEYFGEPLRGEALQRTYDEVLHLGRILQVPERMLPPTIEDYWRYFDDVIDGTLEDHPTAHDVLDATLRTGAPPMLPAPLRRLADPAFRASGKINHWLAVGTLPPRIRDKLELTWTAGDERRLRRLGRVIAAAVPSLPERARYLPIAYHARRAAAEHHHMSKLMRARY